MGKVLIIEDDPLVATMYQKVLSFEGLEVITAENGRVGLDKAMELKPDLVLLDIMMPKMNGIEVLERMKADPELKDIPVIMLTNLSGTHDAELAMEKGAAAYMVKSQYKPKEVAVKAKQVTEKPESEVAEKSAEPVQKTSPQSAPETTPPTTAVKMEEPQKEV